MWDDTAVGAEVESNYRDAMTLSWDRQRKERVCEQRGRVGEVRREVWFNRDLRMTLRLAWRGVRCQQAVLISGRVLGEHMSNRPRAYKIIDVVWRYITGLARPVTAFARPYEPKYSDKFLSWWSGSVTPRLPLAGDENEADKGAWAV